MKITFATTSNSSINETRGVGVYGRELLSALRANYAEDKFLESVGNPFKVDSDLVHYPFFDPFFLTLPLRKILPTIVTIHDVIPLKFSEQFPAGVRGKLNFLVQALSLKSTAHIITDSECSKSDIIEHLSIPSEKISVIPLGPATARSTTKLLPIIKEEYHLPSRYLLYVGDINWNKNVIGLVRAFSELEDSSLHLVLVGKVFSDQPNIPEYKELVNIINNSPAKNRIHQLGFIPTHHLPYLYQHATLYVQPSWYEGFGLTILEAMNQGCPVLSSSRGSLPEVGGQAVMYFDPGKPKEFLSSLSSLISSPAKRKELSELGITQSKNFTWDKTAKLTHQVYEKVLQNISH